jgi:AcrR family transcriptional regulator
MTKYNNELFDRLPADKRDKILRIAAEEFALMGYANTNTNIIAEKAGISVGALFKYFGTKENCFLTVLSEGLKQLEQILGVIMAEKEPILNKIEKVIRLIPEYSKIHGEMVRLYFEVTSHGEIESIREFGKKFEGISAKAYKQIMKEAKREGLLPANADENIYAFCLDNLFMMLQFSYACTYYQQRKDIYLGEKKARNDELVTAQIMQFIKGAIAPGSVNNDK